MSSAPNVPVHPSGMQPRAMIVHEKRLMLSSRLALAIRARYVFVAISCMIGLGATLGAGDDGPWMLLIAYSATAGLLNFVADRLQRAARDRPWHFWVLMVSDTVVIGLCVAAVGPYGYVGIAFLLVASSAHALGLPRAARIQFAIGAVVYPIARFVGLWGGANGPSSALDTVLLEEALVLGLGWLAISGPISMTYRVRRARRALAALERGEFEVRLPARALDDLGFLAVSFNATAEALGGAVRALETEVTERAHAEDALRAGERRLRAAERDATRMADRMRAVANLAAGVLAADSPVSLHHVVKEACTQVLPLDAFAFALYDEGEHALCFPVGTKGSDDAGALIPLRGQPSERVVVERRPLATLRPSSDTVPPHIIQDAVNPQRSVMRVPIVAGETVLGVVSLQCGVPNVYSAGDVEVLETLAALAATALHNIRLVGELRRSREALAHQAYHDALTSLPNRAYFLQRVGLALSRNAPEHVAVLVLDLDGFKNVNDSLGHATGDRLLVAVANRLLNATRGSDTVARLGGDEFAVLMETVRTDDDAILVANRVLRAFHHPFSLGATQTVVGTSVGIARGRTAADGETPRPADEFEFGAQRARDASDEAIAALLRDADLAMYRAKTRGRGQFAMYESELHQAAMERLELEVDLRTAEERSELQLYFQPIIDLQSGGITGMEALLRWMHPRRGTVPPLVFIPVAEESGQIVALGRWALFEACRLASEWPATGSGALPTVAVNVSWRQLQDSTLVDDVRSTLASTNLAPHRLVLELTESTIAKHPELVRERLNALRFVGVQLAVDDFGTGYSALSSLKDFPIDVLKIDKSFVDGVTQGGAHTALARTVVALGDAMRLRTVAEGIETIEQRNVLQAMGCSHGQGYLFGRPMPADQVADVLQREWADAVMVAGD